MSQEQPMLDDKELDKIPVCAKCDSCLENEKCQETLKGVEICRKYHTRVLQQWDGVNVQFYCEPNNSFSEWHKREEFEEPDQILKIAEELHVRPRDVWVLLINDRIPRERRTDLPTFDLSHPLKSDEKRHIRFEVASWLTQSYHFLTIKDTDVIHVYHDGIYVPQGEDLIIETIRGALGEQCTTYDRNETRAIIRDQTLRDRSIFSHNAEAKVCLENGILNLDTSEFKEHTPTEYFLSKIPVQYNPEATCPRIKEFFGQVLDQSDIQTLYEVTGYCLYPSYFIHKTLGLIGDGANGKSTYLNLVKKFLGPENCSSLGLQQLESNRFATSTLVNKLANIYPDIPDIALQHTGVFKMLVGEDPIGAEEKFGKLFSFQNRAKLLFSANKLPQTKDLTDAFFRRWIIINFPNKFTPFSTPKADPNKLAKLTTPEELSGLLNEALKGLRTLLDNGHFTGDKPTAAWREDYLRKSDPIAAFYMDCLIEENNPKLPHISKEHLYQAYIKYCKEKKLPAVDNSVFSRRIRLHFEITTEATVGTRKDKRKRAWQNLRFKTKKEKKEADDEEGKLDDYT